MSNRKQKKMRRKDTEAEEMNLIPVMNLFVCLIPFLLLTASFVRLGAVESELPKNGKALEQKDSTAKSLDLIFQMDGDKVIVTAFRNGFQEQVPEVKASFLSTESEKLDSYVNELAEKYESLKSSLFRAGSKTRFEDAVKVLATIRKNESIKSVVLATDVLE